MGDNFLKQQAKNFRKRKDMGAKSLSIANLFGRPEIIKIKYVIKPDNNERCEVGEVVYATVSEKDKITVVRGHHKVGLLDGESTKVLIKSLRDPNTPGIIPLRVKNVLPLSKMAEAEIAEF